MTDEDVIRIDDALTVPRSALHALARRRHIRHIAVFGSAARGERRADSDIDLLVEFEPGRSPSLGTMVELQDELSALFGGHAVEVATPSILNNPYRRRAIEHEARELYAA